MVNTELQQYSSYAEYKNTLDKELTKTAESFVRIGYLLKVARDTSILADSGYDNVVAFAQAEYGIDKTQVSRFIRINDKFSEGGYSDHLLGEYQGFGYAKLTIMLQLPDAVNEELTPDFSKSEIQAIKDEIDEEKKVSDLEVMMEQQAPDPEGVDERSALLYKAIRQLGEDDPELYVRISDEKGKSLKDILPDIMAPAGDKMYTVRVRGVGKLMLTISGDSIKLINTRTNEKETFSWENVADGWIYAGVFGSVTEEQTGTECWAQSYGRICPVAPVQQQTEKTDTKPQKAETKVQKTPEEWASIYRTGQKFKLIADGSVGELIKKTETIGRWGVELDGGIGFLNESQFEAYDEIEDELEKQETLHELEESIPEPMRLPEADDELKECPGQTEETEEQLEGQQSIEDFPEYMPADQTEVIPLGEEIEGAAVEETRCENAAEEAGSAAGENPKIEKVREKMLFHLGKIRESIESGDWRKIKDRAHMLIYCADHIEDILDDEEGDE